MRGHMSKAAKSFPQSDALRFRAADLADVEALVRLINSAFRVEWPYIEGDRVDAAGVRFYMAKGKFLLAEDSSCLSGCVYVELRDDRGYLGRREVQRRRSQTYKRNLRREEILDRRNKPLNSSASFMSC